MNNHPTSTSRLDLQTRLFITFTVLFITSVLILAFFLQNAIGLLNQSSQARRVFEYSRLTYQMQDLFAQYEFSLNSYAIAYEAADSTARMEMDALSARLDDAILNLQRQGADQAAVDRLTASKRGLAELFNQSADAIEAEDWDTVVDLDEQIEAPLLDFYDQIDALSLEALNKLETVNEQVDNFQTGLYLGAGAAGLLFFILALVTAVLIHIQINRPLGQLEEACGQVLDGSFKPASLNKLVRRGDEIGYMAREFTSMARQVDSRSETLTAEGQNIRSKIK